MSGHLDLDALADLLAGEGDDAQIDHLAACASCSAALADLDQASTDVRATLAALPAPTVPDDLAARLDAALLAAREEPAPRRRTGRVTPLPVTPLPVIPLPVDDGAGVPRALSDGAVDDGPGEPRRGAADQPGPAVPPQRRPGRSRRPALLAAAAVAATAVVGLGGAALWAGLGRGGGDSVTAAAGSAAAPAEAGRAAQTVTDSGRAYGPGAGGLAAALPALLGQVAASPSRSAGSLARLHEPAELAGCLSALPPGAPPLALDYATYDGRPALVVVRPAADPAEVEVAVVGEGCREGSADRLLLTTLPRPS